MRNKGNGNRKGGKVTWYVVYQSVFYFTTVAYRQSGSLGRCVHAICGNNQSWNQEQPQKREGRNYLPDFLSAVFSWSKFLKFEIALQPLVFLQVTLQRGSLESESRRVPVWIGLYGRRPPGIWQGAKVLNTIN